MMSTKRNLYRVRDFQQRNAGMYPTESAIRWAIFNEKTNGLADSGAILRQGRNVFIDEDRWFAWLDRINGVEQRSAA
ncbi:hypothetical protein CCR96_19705 [Halochromatium roseum]|nr:hypothetical protein [Halochromatium roseum]